MSDATMTADAIGKAIREGIRDSLPPDFETTVLDNIHAAVVAAAEWLIKGGVKIDLRQLQHLVDDGAPDGLAFTVTVREALSAPIVSGRRVEDVLNDVFPSR